MSFDEAGRELFFDILYEGPNLPAGNDFYLDLAWGDIEKPADQRGIRFKRIQNAQDGVRDSGQSISGIIRAEPTVSVR